MANPKFEDRSQAGLFNGGETPSIEDGKWACLQIASPAGVWFLVPERKLASKFRKKKDGGTRAVFTKSEMHTANQVLSLLSPDECQEWLGDMIAVKEVFDGANIEKVKK